MAMTVSELQVKVSADTSAAESGLSALGSKVGSIGGTIASAFGTAAVGGILALGAGLTASVGAAANFESAMSAIKAVSGATGAEMESLSGLALQLGADTSFSASEAAAGIGELVKAGVSIADVMGGGAAGAMSLAAAGAIEVKDAAEITSNALNAFGLSGANAVHVADQIAGAANASAIDVNDFKFSLAAVGAVANTVGFTFEDTTAAIALLGNAGIKGSDAGTSLKTMFLNLQPTTKAQIGLFKELGLTTADGANQFFDATGKVKSMSEVAGTLQTALSGMTQQQKLATLETIFGSDAIRAAAVFAKEGSAGIDKMTESIGKISAADVAKERLNNLKGSLEQLQGSVETAGIMLGTALLPGLKSLVDGLTAGVNQGIEIIKQLPGAWEDVKTIFASGSTAGNFEKLLSDLGLSEAMVVQADEWLGRIGDSWRTMQQAFAGDWSPSDQIDPFVTLVGIAATAVKDFGDTVRDAIAKASAMGAWDNITSGFANLDDAVVHASVSVDAISAALGRARGPVGQVATASDILAGAIKGAALGFQYVTLQISGFVDQVGSSIAIAIDFVTAMSRTGDALNKFKNGDIPGAITALGEAKEAFGAGVSAAESFRQRGLDRVAEGAAIMADTVGVHLTATAASVESNMSAANQAVGIGSAGMAQFMESNGAAMVTATDTSMAGVVAVVETSAPAAAAAAEAMGTGMAAGIETAAPLMATAAESGASGAVAAVQGQEGAASGAGQSLGAGIGDGLAAGIASRAASVWAAVKGLVNTAIGAGNQEAEVQSPSKRTMKTGEMMGQGYIEGLSSMAPEMAARIRDFVSASIDYVPVANEIKRVESEIKTIRDKGQTDALFRAKDMITIDSEALRLKGAQVALERDLVPLRQELARTSREVQDIERGSLEVRQTSIELAGKLAMQNVKISEIEKGKIPFQQRSLEIERALLGLNPDNKRAKQLKEEQDEIRKQIGLIDNTIGQIRLQTRVEELEISSNKDMQTVAATGARIRQEALADQARGQETVIGLIKDQIETLGAEQAVFQANENVIKNATDNEIAYRNRLIAVFTAEGKPLADRITAGKALVEQLHDEGKISDELYEGIKKYVDKLGPATTGTQGLGTAAATAAPQIDAASKKAAEMAANAEAIAQQAGAAGKKVDALSSSLGKLPDWFRPKIDTIFKPDHRAMGGPVAAGHPYIVGERRAEMFVPDRSGTILPSVPTGGYGGGDTYITLDARGAQVYDGSKFEDILVRTLDKAQRGGRIVKVTR